MAVTFAAVLASGPSASAVVPNGAASYAPLPCAGIDWRRGVEQRVRLIRCAVRPGAFGPVAGGWRRAVAIARCESYAAMRPRTVTPHAGGNSIGVFQLNDAYAKTWWERWAKPLGLPYRLKNAYINTVVAISKARAEGWSAWGCA